MEKQLHGFSFEQLAAKQYGILLSNCYTDKWDGKLNDIPISIKTEKLGSDIEMADIFRQMNVEEDFFLLVGFWQKEKTNIVEQYLLKINKDDYTNMFNKNFIPRLRNLLNTITNDKNDDDKWKEQIIQLRKDWKHETPNLIRLRFKRDHKNQKRIQCAINNKDFYNYFIPKYKVIEDEWRN